MRVLCLCIFFVSPLAAQNSCVDEEYSQFDFWVGDWILRWQDSSGKWLTGHNSVLKEYDGCVILESFRDSSGAFFGMSVSTFNRRLNQWQQTWVDNHGSYLDFCGKFDQGKMILSRSFTSNTGRLVHQRMVWYSISKDSLFWNWERSDDGGSTWTIQWKIEYKRVAGSD